MTDRTPPLGIGGLPEVREKVQNLDAWLSDHPDDEERAATKVTGEILAGLEALAAQLDDLVEIAAACDMAINWHDPRIIPTEDVPTYEAALRIAREELADSDAWLPTGAGGIQS